jgi:CBS domain-containing protein
VPTGGPLTVVGEIMSPVLSTVPLAAPLSEVASTLLSSGTQCVLVLDAAGELTGIITPGDLMRRLDPAARPSFMQILRSPLPLAGQAAARQIVRQSTAQQARQLMTTPVVSVTPDTPLSTALLLATRQGWKRLTVCDAQQRPLGLVSRKELLGAVLR